MSMSLQTTDSESATDTAVDTASVTAAVDDTDTARLHDTDPVVEEKGDCESLILSRDVLSNCNMGIKCVEFDCF